MSARRWALVVPTMAWMPAGWRRIHATAKADLDTPYFSESCWSFSLRAGNFSLSMNTPSKKPYWKGDQAWMVMPFKRQ